jgi:hypothetical protein
METNSNSIFKYVVSSLYPHVTRSGRVDVEKNCFLIDCKYLRY